MLIPSRLVIARKRRGLTLTRLAELTGLSTRSISLYENGHQEPSEHTLHQLADTLAVSTTFLCASDVDEIPEEAVSFRALSKMTARQRDRALSAGRIALLINDWIDARFKLPVADIPSLTGQDPESAAEIVRARWGLGERPIANVLHLLEAHGARIYSLTAENNELDAFSLYWHAQPFIFLSTIKTGERGRFDAAHELGHLVLHGEYQVLNRPAAEVEANRFAAAFLMPRASVLAQGLRDATPARILQAKRVWIVAAIALTHRLYELELLTEWGYRSACVQLSRWGYRRSEPKGIPRESSQLLSKVFRSLRDDGESPTKIAVDLGITAEELQAHVFGLTLTLVDGGSQTGPKRARDALRLVSPECHTPPVTCEQCSPSASTHHALGASMLTLHFLNVGHGDCTFIELPSGRLMMIDINNSKSFPEQDVEALAENKGLSIARFRSGSKGLFEAWSWEEYYRSLLVDPYDYYSEHFKGRPIFRYIQTHPDMDHMSGLHRFFWLEQVPLENFWDVAHTRKRTKETFDESRYSWNDWLTYLQLRLGKGRDGSEHRVIKNLRGATGQFWTDDEIEVLSPTSGLITACNAQDEYNDCSYVLKITHANRTVILPGDAESPAWTSMLDALGADSLKCDVLKASHHGRNTGYAEDAVKTMAPDIVICSVGKKPDTDASDKYASHGAKVLSTRYSGTITVTIKDDGKVIVRDRSDEKIAGLSRFA